MHPFAPLPPLIAATDFSPGSREAALRAAMLADAVAGGRLCLVHALRGGWIDIIYRWVNRKTRHDRQPHAAAAVDAIAAEEEIAKLADAIAGHGYARPQTLITPGRLGPALSLVDGGKGLLVVGAHTRDTLRDLAMGSTVKRLLRSARRPLLVVRRTAHAPYRRALVATDFSPLTLDALAWAARLAPDAARSVVHAFEAPFEGRLRHAGITDQAMHDHIEAARRKAAARMNTLLAANGDPVVSRIVCHGSPADALLRQAEASDADLIVLGRDRRSALEDFISGGTVAQVLARCDCDVLIVPPEAAR